MIRLENVTKTFRGARVLDGISLEIGLGERIALIGSNGAGKTTLIRCLLGEYVHDGLITIDGLDPRRERARVLGQIGFVPQLPPPLRMPVGRLIDFAASLCGTAPGRIEDIAERLGLHVDAIRSRPFVRLSGGMKQKLLIALALGRDARLLFMDEPAANLDPEARKIFFELLAGHADHAAMLISSHRLDEVASLVNRVVEMDMGRVVLDDALAGSVELGSVLACRIVLKHFEPAFAKTLDGWRFAADAERLVWRGAVAAPDRLRFLGAVARYAGLLSHFSLGEH
ncbi:ABC transporter ATP-binding protein [Thauera linaloolentis]|uniref:ABC transporter related protein n=1 Tax=Thauera linaloolentis (strain DSM 12138 / JCM 21573 / CCUG 41526 / CIP 105981 / IAM 15112 / NBRC 102519 / 47Lol) TaxID=1123367 RepID=N6ZBS6_THAL4|nr:ABC transporter ATP-binding protein [Thauera linaloolentis]ENO89649.1 ABC transporter related protein [Thauera linaloolentis 47Lol = DSM 12138]MCM8567129.1 ABC transporter ATP-binding protein [Thauera linaloolentis]